MNPSPVSPSSLSSGFPTFETPLERYYRRLYCIRTHIYVHQHANGIMVIGIAPGHPCRSDPTRRPVAIQFESELVTASVSGKRKHGSRLALAGKTTICFITGVDGSIMEIATPVKGNVIEINRRLLEDPTLLYDRPDTDGWLAILMPKGNAPLALQSEAEYGAEISQPIDKSTLR